MAYEIPGFSWTLVAGEDLSTSRYHGVEMDSGGLAILPAAGGRGVGVTRNAVPEGGSVTVVSSGIVMGKIGVTGVHAGDNVTVDDDGTFIQAGSGDFHWGRALKTNVAGEVGSILLQIGGATAAGS